MAHIDVGTAISALGLGRVKDAYYPGGHLKLRTYADCRTIDVVYLATCTCGAFYISKIKRTFARQIQDHLYYIDVGLLYTPICKHVILNHGFYPSFVSFFALEVIPQKDRGGDFDKKILQQVNNK